MADKEDRFVFVANDRIIDPKMDEMVYYRTETENFFRYLKIKAITEKNVILSGSPFEIIANKLGIFRNMTVVDRLIVGDKITSVKHISYKDYAEESKSL